MLGEAGTSQSDKRTLWLLTQNANKYEEARRSLNKYGIRIRMLSHPKLEIQNHSLEKIAKFAARNAARDYDRTIVVEDSGLFVKTLNGFPGPFSSYIYSTVGYKGLLKLMGGTSRREAYFQATLALGSVSGSQPSFTGKTFGTISRKPAGTSGFGFDPIFIPRGAKQTFAQGGDDFKERYSHRTKAFRKLAQWYVKTFR